MTLSLSAFLSPRASLYYRISPFTRLLKECELLKGRDQLSSSSLGLRVWPLWILKLPVNEGNASWAVLLGQRTSFPQGVGRWGLRTKRAPCAHPGHPHPKGPVSTQGWAVPGLEPPQFPHLKSGAMVPTS